MAKTTALTVEVATAFAKKVERLVDRWEPIRKDYQKLAERHLQCKRSVNHALPLSS